jgi:hypothetical protein
MINIINKNLPKLLRLVTSLSLLACGKSEIDSSDYFPLKPGKVWVYEVDTEMKDPEIHPTITLSTDRKINFDGETTWVRRSADGVEYYIRKDESGIYRVASRLDNQEQAQLDPARRYIFKNPIHIGTSWEALTVPYLIRHPNAFPYHLKNSHKAIMTYRIEALNQEVEVPYGKFTDCIHVQGKATIKIFTDPVYGFNDVPLVSNEYYCKGIGLVKFDREETVPGSTTTGLGVGNSMTGGKLTYYLTGVK